MMRKYKTLVFDLGEVLLTGVKGVDHKIADQFKIPLPQATAAMVNEHFLPLLRGQVSEEIYLQKFSELLNHRLSPEKLHEIVRNNFHDKMEGVEELLQTLSRSYQLILLSDHAKEWIDYVEANHDWLATFHRRFYSFQSSHLKIEPESFKWLLGQIDASPESCLFIDDNPENVRIARSLNIDAIQFQDADQLKKAFAELGIDFSSSSVSTTSPLSLPKSRAPSQSQTAPTPPARYQDYKR